MCILFLKDWNTEWMTHPGPTYPKQAGLYETQFVPVFLLPPPASSSSLWFSICSSCNIWLCSSIYRSFYPWVSPQKCAFLKIIWRKKAEDLLAAQSFVGDMLVETLDLDVFQVRRNMLKSKDLPQVFASRAILFMSKHKHVIFSHQERKRKNSFKHHYVTTGQRRLSHPGGLCFQSS